MKKSLQKIIIIYIYWAMTQSKHLCKPLLGFKPLVEKHCFSTSSFNSYERHNQALFTISDKNQCMWVIFWQHVKHLLSRSKFFSFALFFGKYKGIMQFTSFFHLKINEQRRNSVKWWNVIIVFASSKDVSDHKRQQQARRLVKPRHAQQLACHSTLKSSSFFFPAGLLLLSSCKCVILAGSISSTLASPSPLNQTASLPSEGTSPSPHFLFYPHSFFSCVCKQRHFFRLRGRA